MCSLISFPESESRSSIFSFRPSTSVTVRPLSPWVDSFHRRRRGRLITRYPYTQTTRIYTEKSRLVFGFKYTLRATIYDCYLSLIFVLQSTQFDIEVLSKSFIRQLNTRDLTTTRPISLIRYSLSLKIFYDLLLTTRDLELQSLISTVFPLFRVLVLSLTSCTESRRPSTHIRTVWTPVVSFPHYHSEVRYTSGRWTSCLSCDRTVL